MEEYVCVGVCAGGRDVFTEEKQDEKGDKEEQVEDQGKRK